MKQLHEFRQRKKLIYSVTQIRNSHLTEFIDQGKTKQNKVVIIVGGHQRKGKILVGIKN